MRDFFLVLPEEESLILLFTEHNPWAGELRHSCRAGAAQGAGIWQLWSVGSLNCHLRFGHAGSLISLGCIGLVQDKLYCSL